MKNLAIAISTVASIILIVTASHARPPTAVSPGNVSLGGAAESAEAVPTPRLAEYSNSGCLFGPRDDDPWPCPEDTFDLTVLGNTLQIVHRNAAYNCCVDDIVVSLIVQGNTLQLFEEEILTNPCDCICCYDVESTVVNLAPGVYTVEYCWYDYETGLTCYYDEIVVTGRGDAVSGPGSPDDSAPPLLTPDSIVGHKVTSSQAAEPLTPHVSDYGDSGCLVNEHGESFYPCGDDEVEFTVVGGELHTRHLNAAYNCCPDEIAVSLFVQGDYLLLTEEEILTNPCYCICCYDVDSTVAGLTPGTYTVEYCWYDFDTSATECVIEEVVIP